MIKSINFRPLLFLWLVSFQFSFAQGVFKQRKSTHTYIFQISEKQAFMLYEEDATELHEAYFEKLIDSFPTSESYSKKLAVGHYLKTNADKNIQHTFYQSMKNFEVFVMNNAKDLIIQVYDKSGTIINNAEVSVGSKTLSYNEKHKAFVDENSNKKGILKVKHEEFTAFYHLNRSLNSSFLSRSTKNLAYQYPTKYVWLPIEYMAMLPFDGVRSIQNSTPIGKVWRTERFFVNLYQKVACWIDSENYYCYEDEVKYDVAYFVFNKPKFKPNDTLKGKAFIWDEKGKPLHEALTVNLKKGYKNTTKIEEILPSRNGSYDLKIHLHDSLQLDLDKHYTIQLVDEDGNSVATNRFLFEEYELKGIDFNMQVNSTKQYNGEELEVTLNAKDENDLRILDGKIEVELLSLKSDFQAENHVFIPDTLWGHQMDLETSKPTKFNIPDTIFPKANVEYKLLAKLTTSDQEYLEATEQIQYYFESEKIKHQVVGDSILVEFLQNGKKVASDIRIESLDHFGNANEIFNETTPFQFQIEPLHKAYRFNANDMEKEVELNSIPTGINAQLHRAKDSVFIKVNNPNQIEFHYHIFRKNKEIESGFESELHFSKAENKLTNYSLTLNYVWAGRVLERNFAMPINDKNLYVKVNQPKLIYPGQKVDVEVEVVDHKENPVENADILAYGMTSKFDFTPNRIKKYNTSPKNRKLRNAFEIESIEDKMFEEPLDIAKWNNLAELKKLKYYQLLYPKKSIFKHEFELKNQPTQFAPFVAKEGELLPVHIIYVNQKPVYFSDMTNVQAYSFQLDDRPVQVQLRTENHLITLDSIQFKANHKTIFSLDVNESYPDVKIEKVMSKLNESERNRLLPFVMPYRLTNKQFAYLQNNESYHIMQPKSGHYARYQFLGPIHNRNLRFVQNKQYELDFDLTYAYQYEFKPQHLIQSSFAKSNYPTFLNHKEIPGFYDLALTEDRIKAMSELDLAKTKQYYNLFKYPSTTSRGNGKLVIEKDKTPSTIFLVNMLNKEEYRVYRGHQTKFENLKPSTYRMILIYDNEDYHIKNDIEVLPNGTTHQKLNNLELYKRDSFSDEISATINAVILKNKMTDEERAQFERKFKDAYDNYETFFGEHHLVEGTVSDIEGVPLPGVVIEIIGTTYGTQTDFDGNFQLRVPKHFKDIKIRYLGFVSQYVKVDENTSLQIVLETDTLDEVVITGYSSKKPESVVPSEIFQLEEAENIPNADFLQILSGQVAGVSLVTGSGQPGQSTTVRIRGNASVNSSGAPLYVINGVPYDGDVLNLSADLIQDVTILKDASATAIYGSRGQNGVILITTSQSDLQIEETAELPPNFVVEPSEANSIRTNFKDEAFWKPRLTTDKEGKVNFSITFPDDVTSWDTYFYAATESQQTGQVSQNVKSYRPLVSQLSIPRYLIEGDRVSGVGKVKNYLKDTIAVQTQFRINEENQFTNDKQVYDFEADKLGIVAKNTDSIQISYQVTRKDNDYLDGEELSIPVFPKGMEKAVGEFNKLQKNDTLKLNFDSNLGVAELKIDASLNSILEEELEVVIGYVHDCNEQIASRLKAQLIKRKIYQQQNRTFEEDKDIKKLIRLHQKNQQSNSLWGWWANSSTNLWASLNAVEALLMADEQGFKVKWDKAKIQQKLTDESFIVENASTRIQLLQLLDVLKTEINYLEEIENLLQLEKLSVVEQFQLWELYQKHGGIVPKAELLKFQKETALGNWYIEAEEKHFFHPYKNSVQASLIAFRILQKMENQEEASEKIKDYLIMQRNFGGYANTFESMQVIETLLNDVPNPEKADVNFKIQVNGGAWQTLDSNSFTRVYEASDEVRVVNATELPIYVNHVQKYFDPSPEKQEDLFEVKTHFENEFGEVIQPNEMQLGKPVQLIVNLDVKKKADYFMLEVPIPSGCNYHDKKQYPNETHRAYAKDKTYIFVESLDAEKQTFSIALMPRYQGNFQLNPTKAQLMYFEQLYGNNEVKSIKLTE